MVNFLVFLGCSHFPMLLLSTIWAASRRDAKPRLLWLAPVAGHGMLSSASRTKTCTWQEKAGGSLQPPSACPVSSWCSDTEAVWCSASEFSNPEQPARGPTQSLKMMMVPTLNLVYVHCLFRWYTHTYILSMLMFGCCFVLGSEENDQNLNPRPSMMRRVGTPKSQAYFEVIIRPSHLTQCCTVSIFTFLFYVSCFLRKSS